MGMEAQAVAALDTYGHHRRQHAVVQLRPSDEQEFAPALLAIPRVRARRAAITMKPGPPVIVRPGAADDPGIVAVQLPDVQGPPVQPGRSLSKGPGPARRKPPPPACRAE